MIHFFRTAIQNGLLNELLNDSLLNSYDEGTGPRTVSDIAWLQPTEMHTQRARQMSVVSASSNAGTAV